MQKCNYCGYVTKYSLDKCPTCGATQYTKIDNFSQYEVENTPTIEYKNIIKPMSFKNIKFSIIISIFLIIALIFLIVELINGLIIGITNDNFIFLFTCFTYLLCILLPLIGLKNKIIVCISLIIYYILLNYVISKGLSIYNDKIFAYAVHIPFNLLTAFASSYCLTMLPSIIRSFSEEKKYNSLKNNGILIKNLNYTTKKDKNNPNLKKLVVKYISKDNIEFELVSKQSFYRIPKDDTVDLLIDKTNFNNYFIDFEIN